MDPSPLPPLPSQGPSSDKVLSILCHVSPFLGVPFLLPLIIYLVKKEESKLVAAHAKEVLNFHISLLIYSICAVISFVVCCVIGFPVIVLLTLLSFICAIIGAVKASEDEFYFYPLTIRLIT